MANELIINKIDIKTVNRTNVDIESWRSSTKSADRGKRTSLYDLYEDILLDNVLSDAIDKRITAITNAELSFTNHNGDAVPIMDTLIDTIEFETILREIMLAKFYGVTLLELEFLPNKIVPYSIDRKHIRANYKEVAVNQNDERGIPYDENFCLEVGDPKDLGLILKATPFAIYKRNNFGDWAQYVELFGMPVRTAYYDAYDEQMRIEISNAFERAGSALVNVLPKGSDLKIEAGATSGDGAIYDKLRYACNEEILIGILGQTMTTLDGSSRSQGEVHMQVQMDKHLSDKRYTQRILNTRLLPMLAKRGYPVTNGYFYFPSQQEALSLKDRITIDTQIATLVPVAQQHFYDTYGVARPADDDELAIVPQQQPMGSPFPPVDNTPQDNIGWLDKMRNFFALAPQVGALKSTTLTQLNDETTKVDAFDDKLIRRIATGESDYFDGELFIEFSNGLISSFNQGWSGNKIVNEIGIDYGVANSAVITANETNLFHFAASKTLAEIQQLNQLYRESKSFEEYYQKATELCGKYNKGWARTEYETARLTAESSATYQRLKEQTDLFAYWEYRTVGDDRVREEHAALDGVILPANDPRWKKIYPPNGWKCRCRVVPRMKAEVVGIDFNSMRRCIDEYFDTADWSAAQAQGFDINRGEIQQVFPANQMYIRKFPQNASKYLDKLTYKSYGLDPYTKCITKASEPAPKYDGSADEWFNSHQKDGVVTLIDLNKRSLTLSANNFKAHTTGSHKERAKYLQSLPDVLTEPDEIWLNAEQGKKGYENYCVIKYYTDNIVVVNCRVTNGATEVRTWYPLAKKTSVINDARRGLLIYKKASQ